MEKSKQKVWEVNYRHLLVFDCQGGGGIYGRRSCCNCARAMGTVYADGFQAGCVNLPAGANYRLIS